MDNIMLKSRAKINLALDVLSKRKDGYHELKMIMQTLNLHDTLFFNKINENKIIIKSNVNFLPTNNQNLVYKAIELIKEEYSIKTGLFVKIIKKIPISAGLAGGSGNCAAALVAMNKLFSLNIKKQKLMKIGKSLGADVPYCLIGGTALCEGIGEKIKILPNLTQCYVVLVKPLINISTANVFKNLDLKEIKIHPDIDFIISNIKNENLENVSKNLCNVLEYEIVKKHPIVKDIKESLFKKNALGAVMSGSGPSVFGLYNNKSDAIEAIDYIKKNFSEIKEIFLTKIFNPIRRKV